MAIAEAEAPLETSICAASTFRSHNCGELTEQTIKIPVSKLLEQLSL